MMLEFAIIVAELTPCESGGIGRRAGFRIQWGNPWEFESPLSHHMNRQAAALNISIYLDSSRGACG
jgi:hypothetical protein